ncbi:MAG: hypothetical protein IPF99_15995 [Deltaproteobacteria bacterium]|nr:hypothetical protein [Deltaproteobacteria bacterium]
MTMEPNQQRHLGAPAPPLGPGPSVDAVGDGRAPETSTREAAWRERGRALYSVPEPGQMPVVLSIAEAHQTIARRMRASFLGLSEDDRDAAIAAAARGYLDAHLERGHSVSVQRAATTARRLLPELAATHGAPAPETAVLLDVHGPHTHSPTRRVRAPSSVGSVTFQVTLGHALAKGLAGGRVRISPGESAIDAIARRIVRDTRCTIVAVKEDGEEVGSDGSRMLHNYRITLHGSDGTREVAGRDIEGVLWVRF